MLASKSLIELRGIAQSLNIADVFQKDKAQLLQAISTKQEAVAPAPKVEIPKPEYDARLMTRPPSAKASIHEIKVLLTQHVARGLHLSFDENEERWFMKHGKKNDEGTIRMPLRIVLKCADKIME